MGELIPSWNGDGVFTGREPHNTFQKMATIYRVQEGSQLSGVCSGLEAAGKGSATGWRLLIVLGTLFAFFPAFIYFACALTWPMAKTKKIAAEKAGTKLFNETSELPGLEANLTKLVEMKEKGLISEGEYLKMRHKELGID